MNLDSLLDFSVLFIYCIFKDYAWTPVNIDAKCMVFMPEILANIDARCEVIIHVH